MSFTINGKIALISGGGSGLGLQYAKELLRNGLKGVTLADINKEYGNAAAHEINSEFGSGRAIFVLTDVTNKTSFEEAFIRTIEVYKNLDILVNNAGVMNDHHWETEINVNLKGTIHGMLLGLEKYIPKYRSSGKGVIVNIASIAGVSSSPLFPFYSATKFAIMSLGISLGHSEHYNRTKVRVLTLCPGVTDTPMVADLPKAIFGPQYQTILEKALSRTTIQRPENVALGMIEVLKTAESGTVWVIEDDQQPYEYILPDRKSFAPKEVVEQCSNRMVR